MAGTRSTKWMRKKCTSSLNKITTNGFPWRWHSHPSHTLFFRHTLSHTHADFNGKYIFKLRQFSLLRSFSIAAVVAIYSVISFLLEHRPEKKEKKAMAWAWAMQLHNRTATCTASNTWQKSKSLIEHISFLIAAAHHIRLWISTASQLTLKHALRMCEGAIANWCTLTLNNEIHYLANDFSWNVLRKYFRHIETSRQWRIHHRIGSLKWVADVPFNFHLWHRIGVASFSTKSHKWLFMWSQIWNIEYSFVLFMLY